MTRVGAERRCQPKPSAPPYSRSCERAVADRQRHLERGTLGTPGMRAVSACIKDIR